MGRRAVRMSQLGSYQWVLTCFYCGRGHQLVQNVARGDCPHKYRSARLPSGRYDRVMSRRHADERRRNPW